MTANKPPPLPLFDMTELDLNGVLFVQFPNEWTLEKSRAVLESLVRRCGDTELSPASVYIAMWAERARAAARLPADVKKARIDAAWARRTARTPDNTRTRAPARTAPAKINPEEWSF